MKNKALLFGAMMAITSTAIRAIFDIVHDGIYSVPIGWGTKLVVLIWSISIVKNSDFKTCEKVLLAALSAVAFMAITVITATLATFGLIEAP